MNASTLAEIKNAIDALTYKNPSVVINGYIIDRYSYCQFNVFLAGQFEPKSHAFIGSKKAAEFILKNKVV